jgi:Ca2+/Na+ antiporter
LETQEIVQRFAILCISIFAIYYFTNRNRRIRLHPLFSLVSICTFFMCLIFKQIEMSVGIGFGLFAVFSILRFRTESFSIQTVIFLFVSITLSMLDILLPIDHLEFLLGINLVIVLCYIFLNFLEKKTPSSSEKNVIEIIVSTDFMTLSETDKKLFLSERIQFKTFSYQIKSINLIENIVIIKVSY